MIAEFPKGYLQAVDDIGFFQHTFLADNCHCPMNGPFFIFLFYTCERDELASFRLMFLVLNWIFRFSGVQASIPLSYLSNVSHVNVRCY